MPAVEQQQAKEGPVLEEAMSSDSHAPEIKYPKTDAPRTGSGALDQLRRLVVAGVAPAFPTLAESLTGPGPGDEDTRTRISPSRFEAEADAIIIQDLLYLAQRGNPFGWKDEIIDSKTLGSAVDALTRITVEMAPAMYALVDLKNKWPCLKKLFSARVDEAVNVKELRRLPKGTFTQKRWKAQQEEKAAHAAVLRGILVEFLKEDETDSEKLMPLLNAAARNDAKERFHPLAHAVVVEAYVAAQPSSGAGGEGNGVASLLKLESDQVRKQIAGATEGVKVLMGNLADAVVNKAQTGDDRFPCATLIDDPEPAKAKAKKNIIDTICTGYLNILSKEASEIATTTGTGGESHKTAVEHLQRELGETNRLPKPGENIENAKDLKVPEEVQEFVARAVEDSGADFPAKTTTAAGGTNEGPQEPATAPAAPPPAADVPAEGSRKWSFGTLTPSVMVRGWQQLNLRLPGTSGSTTPTATPPPPRSAMVEIRGTAEIRSAGPRIVSSGKGGTGSEGIQAHAVVTHHATSSLVTTSPHQPLSSPIFSTATDTSAKELGPETLMLRRERKETGHIHDYVEKQDHVHGSETSAKSTLINDHGGVQHRETASAPPSLYDCISSTSGSRNSRCFSSAISNLYHQHTTACTVTVASLSFVVAMLFVYYWKIFARGPRKERNHNTNAVGGGLGLRGAVAGTSTSRGHLTTYGTTSLGTGAGGCGNAADENTASGEGNEQEQDGNESTTAPSCSTTTSASSERCYKKIKTKN